MPTATAEAVTQPARQPPHEPLRVALLGLGTVGREVARALTTRPVELAASAAGRPLTLVAVGVREPDRDRGLRLPPDIPVTGDLAAVATGRTARADVVVELLGGLEPAGELVTAAFDAGAAVVTGNKALLARRGAALEAHVRRLGGTLRFEAAVGGGLPILGPLAAELAPDHWSTITGIVNSTTNRILTAMAAGGSDYTTALAEAQAAGHAEANPSGDVEGRDSADKLAILMRLAFGWWPDVTAMRRAPPALDGDGPPGITGVTPALLDLARRHDLAVRLVAFASRTSGGATAFVAPCAVPRSSGLGRADWVTNRIELTGTLFPRLAIEGAGAGGPSTSLAVLGDLLAIARGAATGSTWAGLAPATAPGTVTDGLLDMPRRWLTAGPSGPGSLTDRATIGALRRQLAGRGAKTTLLPVLDEVA